MDIVDVPGAVPVRSPEAVEPQLKVKQRRREPSTWLQFVRFCTVGISNAAVDLGALNLLLLLYPTQSDLTLLLYNTIAVALAILNSYLWNTRWTFHDQVTSTRRERVLFVSQALLNIAINNAVLFGLTDLLPTETGTWSMLTANLAKLVAMFASSGLSFILLRTIVFRARRG